MRKLVVIFLCALFATQIHADSDTSSFTVKAGSKEAESVKAAVQAGMSAGLDAKLVGIAAGAKVMADTGVSAERGREWADAVMNQLRKMGYSGSKTLSPQAKQFAEQLQAVDSAMKKYAEISAMMKSPGASVSIPYQDLARRLNDSGAIVDVNNANRALEDKMGHEAYGRLSKEAQYEINNSSARGLMGADRVALAGYLMLYQQDPISAAEILNKVVSPTSGGFNR